jgi:hypothetical protein
LDKWPETADEFREKGHFFLSFKAMEKIFARLKFWHDIFNK